MIEAWHVREALRYRFGSSLVDIPGIWERAAALLRSYAPYRDTFSGLAERMEDVIFNTVYEQLGPSMGAQMDDGTVRRIRSDELREAADDAKTYHELLQDVIDEKISTAKGNVAAMQENARLAGEEHKSKIRSEILKIRMTAKAKAEDFKDTLDKKRLERFIDDRINYVLDCYDAARFGSDAEPEALPAADTEA